MFDIEAAKKAGASEDQIINYLTQSRKYDVQGALSAGADKNQVINYLSSTSSQEKSQDNKPGLLQSIAQGVAQPFLRGVSSVAGIANATVGSFGYKPAQIESERIRNQGIDYGILGNAKPIGSGFDIRNTAAQNVKPLVSAAGTGAEIGSTIAGGGLGTAESILGKSAQFAALGAVSGAGNAAANEASGGDILKAGIKSGLTGAVTGAAFGGVEKGLKSLGDFLGKTGDRIQTSVIKPSQADIKDGFSIETIKKYNLGGSLKSTFEKTDNKLSELSKQLNDKLGKSNSSIDLNSVYENTAKRLLGNKLENFGSNTQMEGAIEKLRNEIVSVSGDNGIVSIPEAQLVKRASGHFGAWNFGVQTPEATASQKVYNTFYNELKTSIEKNSPEGVKNINQEISKLIPVMNAVIRRIPIAERNSALSLTDIISLSAAAINPKALSLSLLNLASKSGTVGAALSKQAPKIGATASKIIQGAEKIPKILIGK